MEIPIPIPIPYTQNMNTSITSVRWFFATTVLIGLACSCGASGELFTRMNTAPSNAVFYVYRPDIAAGASLKASVFVKGEFVGSVSRNGYLTVRVPPGIYRVEAEMGGAPMSSWKRSSGDIVLDATGGQEYFFRILPAFWRKAPNINANILSGGYFGSVRYGFYFHRIEPTAGLKAISRTRRSAPDVTIREKRTPSPTKTNTRFTSEEMEVALRPRIPDIRACFGTTQEPPEEIQLRLQVRGDGRAIYLRTVPLQDQEVNTCIRNALEGIRFRATGETFPINPRISIQPPEVQLPDEDEEVDDPAPVQDGDPAPVQDGDPAPVQNDDPA